MNTRWMVNNLFLAGLAVLATACGPDLKITVADVSWDNYQQAVSFTLENQGDLAASAFNVELALGEGSSIDPGLVHKIYIPGLAPGEKSRFEGLSLRYFLHPENECLGQATSLTFSIDPQNVVVEQDEKNNYRVLNVDPICLPCDEMVRFEDLPSGIEFTPISHIASEGTRFAIGSLEGNSHFGTVRTSLATGWGKSLWLNHVWLQPKLSAPRHYIAFDVVWAEGTVYLEINGDAGGSPYTNAETLNGTIIGGVRLELDSFQNGFGVWHLYGPIHSLKVGGQDLAIDNMLFWKNQINSL